VGGGARGGGGGGGGVRGGGWGGGWAAGGGRGVGLGVAVGGARVGVDEGATAGVGAAARTDVVGIGGALAGSGDGVCAGEQAASVPAASAHATKRRARRWGAGRDGTPASCRYLRSRAAASVRSDTRHFASVAPPRMLPTTWDVALSAWRTHGAPRPGGRIACAGSIWSGTERSTGRVRPPPRSRPVRGVARAGRERAAWPSRSP